MLDGIIDQAVLKAKARSGAGEDVLVWLAVGIVLGVIAVVFLSVALYAWLTTLYGAAVAALGVGVLHVVLAGAAVARCVAVRRRNRRSAQQRLAAIAKSNPWPIDPTMLAVGLEIGKTIGWRRVVPLAVAGVGLLTVLGAGRRKHDTTETAQPGD